MVLLFAATLAVGATAGWMLEHRFGRVVARWGRMQISRFR
jgi:hypothetical protein